MYKQIRVLFVEHLEDKQCYLKFNPIRSVIFQTANDPEGSFKSPPPPATLKNLENFCINFTILYMCILLGVLGMFQLIFFKIRDYDYFTSISKYKVARIVVKMIFFAILFKFLFKSC